MLMLSFVQEFITFYSMYSDEIYNVETLGSNFNLTLPFREADLPFDSDVIIIFVPFPVLLFIIFLSKNFLSNYL